MTDKNKLALYGGCPVRNNMLSYGKQSLDNSDIESVISVLKSDYITTGPKVEEFEKVFSDYVGSKHAVSFSSGTAALHGSVFAAGIKQGDEVITTPMSFAASSNCILYQKATPVFADIRSDNLNIDPNKIVKKITSKTKAIIPVDYAGHPTDLDEILGIAKNSDLIVIEDGCHALGAEYKGRKIGSISNMTVFSFHPVKQITTGEGGMVATNDSKLAQRLRMFRNHCINTNYKERDKKKTWHYEVCDLGYNYRLTDIQSALGINQLTKLPLFLERRREIARKYDQYFSEIESITPLTRSKNIRHAYHLYVIKLNLEFFSCKKEEIYNALRAEGIGVNVHYIPIYKHPYYQRIFPGYDKSCPIAEQVYEQTLSLPIFPDMTQNDVNDVINAFNKIICYYGN